MPEFQMNGKDAPEFESLDDFTRAYIEAAFFTEEERLTEESGGELPGVLINLSTGESTFDGPSPVSFDMLAPETLQSMIEDCRKFQADNAARIFAVDIHGDYLVSDPAEHAGHDFWLTRNGHGAGFWDGDWPQPYATELTNAAKAFGETSLYIGDDGKIYA